MEGASKLAGLFALFVLSPGHRVERDEIAAHVWPEGGASDNVISRQLSYLRESLGGRVGRMKSGACSMDLSDSRIDYLISREEAHRARGMNAFARFHGLCGAREKWSPGGPLQGLPGRTFERRRAELREEWGVLMIDCLAAAWEIREDEWLLKETEDFMERFPDNWAYGERIFTTDYWRQLRSPRRRPGK
ncbi:hypothetical protein ADL22_30835 [Streptomyces sp. NRRL F-4489]|nr:hypothetical protein ADL22_30835 [Streptomyces sp. NRRL F-4489]